MPPPTETTPLLRPPPASPPSSPPQSPSPPSTPPPPPPSSKPPQKKIYTTTQKRLIILIATLASSLSPLSSNIYYPALNSIGEELHVSSAKINLTITAYMVCQSLSPTLTASLSDTQGRKKSYIFCLSLYILSNTLLASSATCHSFAALLAYRGLQSTGISGTVALSAAVAADLVEPDERGMYMGLTSLGNVIAPTLGPVLGGVLVGGFGWRGVFWALAVAGGGMLLGMTGFFPETRGYKQQLQGQERERDRRRRDEELVKTSQKKALLSLLKPLSSLSLILHFPTGLILLSNGLIFASYYAITAGIPSQFKDIYGLSDMGIGLVFLPAGVGSLASATFNGRVVDWNYRRCCEGFDTKRKDGNGDGDGDAEPDGTTVQRAFSVERARLQIGGPMTFLSAMAILTYGLVLDLRPPLPVSLVLIFLVSFSVTASYNVMNVLLVDLYYSIPATVMATNNFVRCFLGAASTALVTPMIDRLGNGRTYAVVATLIVGVCCPLLGIVYWRGSSGGHRER
ncbi:putative MFS efflux transporter [Aspergillus undulatus]|uniref:putative MFS efflux transporter n=1 Tax=Aspergillus undulatus TaxID=1810928 RepID=UPI003CCD47A1